MSIQIEYSETFEKFWGHKAFVFTQILFFACVVCLNVSSIVDTAQVVDTIAGHWLPNGTGAILFHELDGDFRTDWVRWDYTSCTEETLAGGDCIPFGENEDAIVFSLGYFLVLLIFVPMALMDLKVNNFEPNGMATRVVCVPAKKCFGSTFLIAFVRRTGKCFFASDWIHRFTGNISSIHSFVCQSRHPHRTFVAVGR